MMDKKNDNLKQPQQINIELDEKTAEGIYSNLAVISHSAAEFIIDFTRLMPGIPKAKVQARIVMTPQHCKLLMNALTDNIRKFEKHHGEIKIDGQMGGGNPFPMGFPGQN